MPTSTSRRAKAGRRSPASSSSSAASARTRRCGTRCRPLHESFRWFAMPTDDYARACAVGAELAKEFALYLRDNDDEREGGQPFHEVMAAQAAAEAAGASTGYRVGFWAELAKYLAHLASGAGFDAFTAASIGLQHREAVIFDDETRAMRARA